MWWLLPLWLNVLLGLWAILLVLLYLFLTSQFNHWRDKGVNYEKGVPFFGSLFRAMTMQEHMTDTMDKIYKKHQGERYVGIFQGKSAALLVRDPELIKSIMVKDFANFYDHGMKVHEEADPLQAKSLFNLEGHRWKVTRAKISPTFTSGKIKMMTPLMEEVGRNLQKHLSELAEIGEAFNFKEISSRFTTDVIGTCAFGINCNSMANPNSEFRLMGRKLVEMDLWRGLKAFAILFLPDFAMTFKLKFISDECTNFFRKMVHDVIELRKKTNKTRKDFIQLIIELKEKGEIKADNEEETKEINELSGFADSTQHNHIQLSHDDFTAHATTFFLGGFEPSSILISHINLELAIHTEIQSKLQEEIDLVLSKHCGKITYEALKEMKYMDAVVQEILRKYPPAAVTTRICTKNYIIPDSDVHLEEGTPIIIPNYSLQNDPKYFPDPERFDPDRFMDQNALHNYQFIHMPFGEGPRQCIGNRFALMQTKMGLATIFSKFSVSACKNTKYPVKFDPRQFVLTAVGGIWLKIHARNNAASR